MPSKDIIYDFQLQIIEIFESQDPELLDTVFEIDGKKLYADKLRLSAVSSTLKSMLSDRWNTNNNEPIKIKTYKYEDFREFLTFIYSGKCNVADSNVFDLLDMAEFYQINQFKNYCDEYLSKMKLNFENVFQLFEISEKYSLIKIKEPIELFISKNFKEFLKCNKFVNEEKPFFENTPDNIIYTVIQRNPEEAFQAIYEWTEEKAMKLCDGEIDNLRNTIQNEIAPFLPVIPFMKMKKQFFLKEYVVNKDFLFSPEYLNELVEHANSVYHVIVTNTDRETITGSLPRYSDVSANVEEIIKALKNRPSYYNSYEVIYWKIATKIPTTPSIIKKRKGIEWYLVYFNDGDIGLRHYSGVNESDYLLAEMFSDGKKFVKAQKCKIEIV